MAKYGFDNFRKVLTNNELKSMDVQDELLNKLHSIEMGRRSNWNTFSEQVKELLKEYGLTVCEEIKMSEAIGDKMPPLPESGDLDKIKEYLRAFKKQQKRFEYQLSDEIGKHLYQRGAETGYLTAVFEVLKETTSKQKKKIFACIYVEILITGELSHEVLLWLIHSYRQLCTKGESTDSIAAQISGDKLDFSKIERKTAISILYALQVPLEKAEKMLTDGYGSDMFDPRSFMEMVYVYGMLHHLPYNAGNDEDMSLTKLMRRSAESVMRYLFGEFVDDTLLSVCPLPPEQMLDMNRLDETAAVLALIKCGANNSQKLKEASVILGEMASIEVSMDGKEVFYQHKGTFAQTRSDFISGILKILKGMERAEEANSDLYRWLKDVSMSEPPKKRCEILDFVERNHGIIKDLIHKKSQLELRRWFKLGAYKSVSAKNSKPELDRRYQMICDWLWLLKKSLEWHNNKEIMKKTVQECGVTYDQFSDIVSKMLKNAMDNSNPGKYLGQRFAEHVFTGHTETKDITNINKEYFVTLSTNQFIKEIPYGMHFYDEIGAKHVSVSRLNYVKNRYGYYKSVDCNEKLKSIIDDNLFEGWIEKGWENEVKKAASFSESCKIVEEILKKCAELMRNESYNELAELADWGVINAGEIADYLRNTKNKILKDHVLKSHLSTNWRKNVIAATTQADGVKVIETVMKACLDTLPENEETLRDYASYGVTHAEEIAESLRNEWKEKDFSKTPLTRTYIFYLIFREYTMVKKKSCWKRALSFSKNMISDEWRKLCFAPFNHMRFYEDALFFLCLTTDSPMQTFMELINDPDFAFPSVETDRIKKDLYLKD